MVDLAYHGKSFLRIQIQAHAAHGYLADEISLEPPLLVLAMVLQVPVVLVAVLQVLELLVEPQEKAAAVPHCCLHCHDGYAGVHHLEVVGSLVF